MKALAGCGCKVPQFTAMALETGRVASPTLGRLYPWRKPLVLILYEAEWTPGQSGHEGVKKELHPSDARDQARAVHPLVKRLAT